MTMRSADIELFFDEARDFEFLEPMQLVKFDDLVQLGSFESYAYLEEQEYLVDFDDIDRENSLVVYISHNWLPVVDDFNSTVDNSRGEKFEIVSTTIDTMLEYLMIGVRMEVYVWMDYCCVPFEKAEQRKRISLSIPYYLSKSDLVLTPITSIAKESFSEEQIEVIMEEARQGRENNLGSLKYELKLLERNSVIRTEVTKVFDPYVLFHYYFQRPWTRLEHIASNEIPVDRASNVDEKFAKLRRLGSERPHLFCIVKNHKPNIFFFPRLPSELEKSLKKLKGCEKDAHPDKDIIDEVHGVVFDFRDLLKDSYKGDMNDEGLPHGFGVMTYTNGERYEGNWNDGLKEGEGVYTYTNKAIYDGEWSLGLKHGKGKLTFPNGDVYVGDFEDGFRQGEGELTFAKGGFYKGGFLHDEFDGHGQLEVNQLVYEGYFKNGRMDGKGKYEDKQSGLTYDGSFKNDSFHGNGVLNIDKERYEGKFVKGKKHGFGSYYYDDYSKYEGTWRSNMKHGKGEYHYQSGNNYKGSFRKDKKDGYGVFNYANGDRYEGEFKADKYHGQGVFEYADKSVYKGQWLRGKMHGRGAFYYAASGDVYKG